VTLDAKRQFRKVEKRLSQLKADVNELPEAERITHLNSLNAAAPALEKTLKAFKSEAAKTR
jgi:hypothetical protein